MACKYNNSICYMTISGARILCSECSKDYDDMKKENKKLKEFVREIIRQECWGGGGVDGGDIQDIAEKHGLIEKKIATDDDWNPDCDFDTGDSIFVFSDLLNGGE
jgi:hypothetical protein